MKDTSHEISRTESKAFMTKLTNKKASSTPEQAPDSTTKVHFSNPSELACYRNRRVVRSFRVDEGLWEAFKPVAQAKWGSVCKCIEELLSVVLHHDAEKVYIGTTVNPMNIEKIVIERNLRPRRRLEISDDVDDLACHYCGKSAIGSFRYLKTGRVYPLCGFHAGANLDSGAWGVVVDA